MGPRLIILADAPDALCVLFGISLLERLLRVLQRLGFREALILSDSPEEIRTHLAKPSWARADVALCVRTRAAGAVRVREVATDADRTLVISAGFYYDPRLLKTLAEQTATTLLTDSAPPAECLPLWKDQEGNFRAAALLEGDWLSRQDHSAGLMDRLSYDAAAGLIGACDAAEQPTHVIALRKHVRPVFCPAPSADCIAVAERFPREAAQNGTLDFPGWMHAPVENWIVARLCRTSITPNQITVVTALIGAAVTGFFLTGHLWLGLALALAVAVLDGVDGKLARTKVETTAAGNWEHVADYCIELSWWTALAYYFRAENLLPSAYWLLLLFVSSDLVDRLAKRSVKKNVGRNLDDVANIDRFVRCIGARRNINIWILAAGLALGNPANAFVLICGWGAATAAAHVIRAWQIRFGGPVGSLFSTKPLPVGPVGLAEPVSVD